MKTTFVKAGKSIGGGELTHVKRGRKIIGTIVAMYIMEDLYIVQIGNDSTNFMVCHSMDEAKGKFENV